MLALGSGYANTHGSRPVRAFQRRLAAAGYSPGPIDGRYGPLTKRAVVRFQATHRLAVDGIAGPHTISALTAPTVVLYPGDGYLASGSRLVRVLQRHLAAAGFSPGPIDGRYGPLTKRAVARFQASRHLPVDGIARRRTLERLQGVRRRQAHHQQRPVQSRPSTAKPHSRRAPSQTSGAGTRAAPGSVPRGHRATRSGGSLFSVWMIVLAVLLLALLAGIGWYRRRARAGRLLAAPAEPAGNGAFRTSGRPANGEVPDSRVGPVGLGEAEHPVAGEAGATDALRRADELGHPAAAFDLGLLLVQQGDRAGAKEAFRRADQRGHVTAAFDLGALLLQEGDRAGAEEAFRRADQRGDAGAACNLGVLLEQRGDPVGAKEAYLRADERGHRVGACNLGAMLEQEGDLVGAKEAYLRADERGDSLGACRLGVLLEQEGDPAGAKAAYGRADQRGHPEAACNLGLLLKQEGDRAGARQALRRAGERGSDPVAEVAQAALLELDPHEESEQWPPW
jgi:peptidoglycan hydrolase-like protein with peptidoglycan-binding domain/TPR repeat protein